MTTTQKKVYTLWLTIPCIAVFTIFFIVPTALSFFYAFTTWTLKDWTFTGWDNFLTFFQEKAMITGLKNTVLYTLLSCGCKVVMGFLLGALLSNAALRSRNFIRSIVYFPTLVGTLAVGATFKSLMNPSRGLLNRALSMLNITGPNWLGKDMAIYSIIIVNLWRGIGTCMVIYIAGILAIPNDYYEALSIDGGNWFDKLCHITLPLCAPAMNSVILLSFVGGLRSWDLVWALTQGGPGYASDVLASVIYKQFSAGYYGLATAGNVILFVAIMLLAFPLQYMINRREAAL